VFRAGWFIGPFISAGLIYLTGEPAVVFWVFIVFCLATVVILLLLPDPAGTFGAPSSAEPVPQPGLFATIWESRAVLARLGTGAALVGAMRASRIVILPLWAVSIGINEPDTALIIGIAGGIDFALFYVSGQIMDRFGRIWSALPAMIGLGLGHLVLAFTHDLSANVEWFIAVAMFLALANGVGSGILMTLGADLAPVQNPAQFLGAWRFTSDLGGATAPLFLAGMIAVASLSLASGVMGAFGLAGAVILGRYIPRYSSFSRRRPGPRR
jgi:MFS family permease